MERLTTNEKVKKFIDSYNQEVLREYQKEQHFENVYCYPNTYVLKNKLGIKNYDELQQKERLIVATALSVLNYENATGNFDISHLKAIHFILFNQLYDFAGEFRTINLNKGMTNFCSVHLLVPYLKDTLEHLRKDIKKVTSKKEFVSFLAKYYSNLNMAHPFREGNGRTIREFFRQLVYYYSPLLPLEELYEIDYSLMDREKLLEATIDSIAHDNHLLELELAKGLVGSPEEKEEKVKLKK